ncbi:hypothetical protein NM208_g8843 [Fusarium decemcellulare]|uniref:Uncharacterized protein n=2 Tax=Fusarium decemcellulare TaxID=57161 RepID=A0ACC1S2D3_9HYPO|nr:hypothetical protein NM208_g9219 [Fusarium decemcellulare]KAJ3531524.1 hypothetical protein NM208_g8843 [Fusarium decemcellulare]
MGLVLIQRACERFQKQLSDEDCRTIQVMSQVDDVRQAICQVEKHLASRQSLRHLDRLTPFVDAMDRLSKPIDVLCNGTPFMPYAWTAQHHTHALDKLLTAYGSIGAALPRLARYGEAFPDNHEFQLLLSYMYSDIIEFHSRAYRLIRKPSWQTFFASGWGRFEHQFDALLQNISQTSDLIDRDAASFHIVKAQEYRQKSLDDAENRERRREYEQREAVLRWLEVGDSKSNQEVKLEWLRSHCCEGTSQWLTKSQEVRSWLQFGRGHPVLWLHGKPGSGKSVLCSQLIYFLRSSRARNCLFFFCDFHTASYGVTVQILRSICAQMIDLNPELASFMYDECVAAGRTPSISYLKTIVPKLIAAFNNTHIIIDGIDEVDYSQHAELIKTFSSLAEGHDNFRVMFSSQDISSIRSVLKKKPKLFIGDKSKSESIAKDLSLIVATSLQDLNDRHGGGISDQVLAEVRKSILDRAEGMFLWVYLVLKILEAASSIEDLRMSVKSLPTDLADAYNKILTNITRGSSPGVLSKQRRVFGWMLFAKGSRPLYKYELRTAMTLHSECRVVNKDTKPFPNALDICKPFIEDGPQDRIVFIHSTVPQFFLNHSYGPFINEIHAHEDISIACISQLLQSLCFITEHTNSSHLQYLTGHGFHGLLPYAIENWAEHLLDYLKKAPGGDALQASPMMKIFLELSHEHDQLSTIQGKGEAPDNLPPELESLHNRMGHLENFPVTFSLLIRAMRFREASKATNEPSALDSDPTLFSRIREEYHKCVIHLMAQRSSSQISQEELRVFKEEFGPSAFVCVQGAQPSRHAGAIDAQSSSSQGHSQHGPNQQAQSSQTRRPPMYTPQQINELPALSDEEKSKYTQELQGLWNKANTSPTNSQEHIVARQQIVDFSKMLSFKIQQRRQYQLAWQQQQQQQMMQLQQELQQQHQQMTPQQMTQQQMMYQRMAQQQYDEQLQQQKMYQRMAQQQHDEQLQQQMIQQRMIRQPQPVAETRQN